MNSKKHCLINAFYLIPKPVEESSDDFYYERRTISDQTVFALRNFFYSITNKINHLRETTQERIRIYRRRYGSLDGFREYQIRREVQRMWREVQRESQELHYREFQRRLKYFELIQVTLKGRARESGQESFRHIFLPSGKNPYQLLHEYETMISRRSFCRRSWCIICFVLFIISIACIFTTYFRLKESATEATTSATNSTTDFTTESN